MSEEGRQGRKEGESRKEGRKVSKEGENEGG
jgi:hypothetical protein